jgi:hypothetical protein
VVVECTICLYCRVAEWSYHRTVSLDKKTDDQRLLSLTGETELQGLVEKVPYDLRIVAGPLGADEIDVNILSIDEAMPEFNYPKMVSALIPVPVEQFDDLWNCLFYAAKVSTAKVIACLTIETLRLSGDENYEVCFVEDSPLDIVNLAWELSVGGEQ